MIYFFIIQGYGHVGDGNLHLNVSAPAYDIEVQEAIEPFIYEWITEKRGTRPGPSLACGA